MKFSRLFAAALVSFAFVAANAGEEVQRASLKLKNVVNNSLPADQRAQVLPKVEAVDEAIQNLEVSLRKLENVVDNNVPAQYRAQLNQKIDVLKAAVAGELGAVQRPEPRPEPRGNGIACMAACKNADGSAALRFLGVGTGEGRLLALDSAQRTAQSKHGCNFGTVEVECGPRSHDQSAYTCQAACNNADGSAAMSYTALATGASEIEAYASAAEKTQSVHGCNFGVKKTVCERTR